MKIMVMPRSKEEILSIINNTDAFLLGVKDLCANMPSSFTMEEINELIGIIKNSNKEVFIALNKNMHNKDLDNLKQAMSQLEGMVDGILYYDVAIVNIKEEMGYKTPLVWGQEHMTTNYVSSNYWHKHGSIYTLLSSEITLDEVKEIKESSQTKLILPIFGHLSMFVSKRHLVKNYMKAFNLESDSSIHYMEKNDKLYPLIDDQEGTTAYSSNVLNGIRETIQLKQINLDYILLNSFNIPNELFKEIVEMFKNVNEENVDMYEEKIDNELNTDRGFLYKETIYRVKK